MATLPLPTRGFLNFATLATQGKRMSSKIPSSSLADDNKEALFGRFRISPEHIFYRSETSIAFVNLRPIVPGHVLVMPKKNVPHLKDLNEMEYTDLWATVRKVQSILEQHKDQQLSFNVAVQDGRDAGQSVPHVHVHILPRIPNDFARNDDIYTELEEWAPRQAATREKGSLNVPDDSERRDRTPEEMAAEAAMYRSCLARL